MITQTIYYSPNNESTPGRAINMKAIPLKTGGVSQPPLLCLCTIIIPMTSTTMFASMNREDMIVVIN